MENKYKILITDDEKKIRNILKDILDDEGYQTFLAENGQEALKILGQNRIDLMLLDLRMPGMDGIEVLREIQQKKEKPEVIIISAHGTVQKAVQAVQLGAFDFIEKPVEIDRLLITVNNALKQKNLQDENVELKKHFEEKHTIIGEDSKIKQIKQMIDRASKTNAHVLITGENGTGKDLVAKNIHNNSDRALNNFVVVNCAAIPANLIESEMFGYEKGAFTGASKRQAGKFEHANHGTLFLNEIGEMSSEAQAKLLHVIETSEITRLGGNATITVDVRIIAATNKNIHKAISDNTFREDLFYRLNVITIHIPPLRERTNDIVLLADYFLQNKCRQMGTNIKTFSEKAKKALTSHNWPGNVRELNNMVEKLVIFTSKDIIDQQDIFNNMDNSDRQTGIKNKDLRVSRNEWEKQFIVDTLKQNNWNIKQAAKELNIERTYLHRRMKQLDIS